MSDRVDAAPTLARQPLFWIAVILVFALVAGFLGRPQGQRADRILRSSFRTTPDGVAALARGIERLGRTVAPRITPLVDADPVRGTIVLLQSPLPPTPRETAALLNRVREGGTLIHVPPYLRGQRRTAQTPLMDSLGVFMRFRNVTDEMRELTLEGAEWAVHPLTEGLPAPGPPVHGLRIAGAGGDDEAENMPDRLTVEPLLTARDADEEEWTAAAELDLGRGRVVLVSDAEPLSNAEAADDPLSVLVVRAALAYTGEADTVFFAEYHQGIRGHRTRAQVVQQFFFGNPGGRMLFHLIVVCFLVLACLGLRFGAPAPAVAPPDRERRSPLEHVSALGDLYRKAGATRTAALLLLSRLARASRYPPPRDVAEADTLLRRLDTEHGADTPLARARTGLHMDPPDLAAVANGIDEHLARRTSP